MPMMKKSRPYTSSQWQSICRSLFTYSAQQLRHHQLHRYISHWKCQS